MFGKSKKNREGFGSGLAMATTILLMHVVVIGAVGLLVIFIAGIVNYMLWILLFGMGMAGLAGLLFYRRLRREGRSLRESLRSPELRGREVEISFLGGMASMRLGAPSQRRALEAGQQVAQLEDPQTVRIREIETLARLMEDNLITAEEFAKAKQRLLDI